MNRERLQTLLSAMAGRRLLIIGDYFLDLYLEIDQRTWPRPPLETGLEAHQVVARRASRARPATWPPTRGRWASRWWPWAPSATTATAMTCCAR